MKNVKNEMVPSFPETLRGILGRVCKIVYQIPILTMVIVSISVFSLDASVNIKGVCIDSFRRPVADVSVELYQIYNDILSYSAKTDENGFFSIDSIQENEYQIRLGAKDSFPQQWYSQYGNTRYPQYKLWLGPAIASDTLRIMLTVNPIENAPTCTLTVNVIDSAGAPVQKSSVELIRESDRSQAAYIYNDSSSSTRIVSLQSAQYAINVSAPPYPRQYYDTAGNRSTPNYFIFLATNEHKIVTVKLTMFPSGNGMIVGKCLDNMSIPITGLQVTLYRQYDSLVPVYQRITSESGVFSFLNIYENSYYLKVSGNNYPDQWYSRNLNTTQLFPDDPVWTMPTVDTLIIYTSLNPADNIPKSIVKIRTYTPEGKVAPEYGKIALVEMPSQRYTTTSIDLSTGLYVSSPIKEGLYALALSIPTYPNQFYNPAGNTPNDSYHFTIKRGDTLFIEVNLKRSFTDSISTTYAYITGKVTDSLGLVGNALVSVFEKSGAFLVETTTDSSGIFKPLRVNAYEMFLRVKAYGYPEQFWTQNNGRPTSNVSSLNIFSIPSLTTMTADLMLVPNPRSSTDSVPYIDTTKYYERMVCGQVKNATGPVAGVRVVLLQRDHNQYGFSPQNIWTPLFTYTDSAGTFIVRDPPMGSYLIAAIADSQNLVAQFFRNVDLPVNATSVRIDTGVIEGLTFLLRKGGIVSGSVVDISGSPVANARVTLHEKADNGRYYEAISNSDGKWMLRGIPGGIWYPSLHHEYFIQNTNNDNEITVSEGTAVTVQKFTMTLGGRIGGSVTFPSTITKESILYTRGSIQLFPPESENSDVFIWPSYRTDCCFMADTLTGNVSFVSGLCPPGRYRMMYLPEPSYWSNNTNSTDSMRSSGIITGYSFFNNDTSLASGAIVTISGGDTSGGNTLPLRRGGSLFGTLNGDGVTVSNSNYCVDVFVKSENQYVNVSSSAHLDNGKFELPGLIDGERYYFKARSEGYPDQFWSPPGKNSTFPKETVAFSTNQPNVVINLIKDPEGTNVDVNRYLSLWWEYDAANHLVLKWTISPNSTIDTMHVYTRSESTAGKRLASIAFTLGKNTYDYTDTRALEKQNEYCIVGQGHDFSVRSDQVFIDTRSVQNPQGDMWIDVSGNRYGIGIAWGINDTGHFTERDSVVLYKRALGGVFREVYRRAAFEQHLYDAEWSHSDSLKTFEYMVELLPLKKSSPVRSFKLDHNFFASLAREIRVGPKEKYTTIQQAIDVAGDYDFISVQSGIYREQLNFRGKTIGLHSQWNDKWPAVLDASGGTAITIPVVGVGVINEGGTTISGFKITNAVLGIQTSAHVHINRCLFAGTLKAVVLIPDSTGIAANLLTNPFTYRDIYVGVDNCTFIATRRSAVAAVVNSLGSLTTTDRGHEWQRIQPLKSIQTQIGFHNSLFAYFGTTGAATTFPVTLSGAYSSAWIDRCATWQTPATLVSNVKINQPMVSHDPQFKDTIYYFCKDSSVVRTMGIGYDSDYYKREDEEKQRDLAAITNLVIFNKTVDKMELRWDPAPLTDSSVFYRIYRLPGDTSLFFVNSKQLWDIVVDEDSLFTIMDTFTTEKTGFIDSTIVPGTPYLYAVCSVDKHGKESPIRFPATKPVKSYFSNVVNYEFKLKAGQWNMISPWGRDPVVFDTSGNYIVYQWDPLRAKDKLLSYYSLVRSMKPGIGYWIKSLKDTVIRVSRDAPAALKPVQGTLRCMLSKSGDGWNQVASPFPHRVNPKLPSQYVLWEWMPDSMGYRRVTMMEPWKGYWIYTEKDTGFSVNSGDNDIRSLKSLAKRSLLAHWELSVSLIGKGGYDQENILGVIPSKGMEIMHTEIPEPPQPFGGNHVYFVKKSLVEKEEKTRYLSYQYFQSDALPKEKLEWQVGIHSSNGPSTLCFSGIETCPEPVKLFWVYKGVATDLRKTAVIPIEASIEETYGYIVASANPIDIAIYSMTFALRSPYPNPSMGNVKIEYVIPYTWDNNGLRSASSGRDVTVELFDLSGRLVRKLLEEKKIPGMYTIIWDGKTQSGTPVGAGLYIIRFRNGDLVKHRQLFRVR